MDIKSIILIAGIILIIIYLVYEIIKEKNRNKKDKKTNFIFESIKNQLLENSQVNIELLKYLKISSQKYVEEITESQLRIIIESILNVTQLEIYNYTEKIIKENHIKGNEKEVTLKIKSFINNKFHKDALLLKEFKFKENCLNIFMKNEWKEYIIENIISCVLKEKGERNLWAILQNSFDSFKYDLIEYSIK